MARKSLGDAIVGAFIVERSTYLLYMYSAILRFCPIKW